MFRREKFSPIGSSDVGQRLGTAWFCYYVCEGPSACLLFYVRLFRSHSPRLERKARPRWVVFAVL